MNDSGYNAVLVLAVAAVLAAAAAGFAPPAAAQNRPAQDCLELALQATDDPTLTREERIAALDKALLKSLSRTGLCGAGAAGDGVGAGGTGGAIGGGAPGGVSGAGDAAGAAGAGDAANTGSAPVESLPASGVQGDLPDAVETAAANPTPESTDQTGANTNGAPSNIPGVDAPSDGTVPDDIPPSANDDIIAKQLREAATNETDPQTRAKLWNEYRRYKNLPVKEVPAESAGDSGETADQSADAGGDAGAN